MSSTTSLDKLSLRQRAEIAAIDWSSMSKNEGLRLRALGIDEGVSIEKTHKGMFGGDDPVAVKVGRMMVALRKSHAVAISVIPAV